MKIATPQRLSYSSFSRRQKQRRQRTPEASNNAGHQVYEPLFEDEQVAAAREEDMTDPFRYSENDNSATDNSHKNKTTTAPAADVQEHISMEEELGHIRARAKAEIAAGNMKAALPYLLQLTEHLESVPSSSVQDRVEMHASVGLAAYHASDRALAEKHYLEALRLAESGLNAEDQESVSFAVFDARLNLAEILLPQADVNLQRVLEILLPALRFAERMSEDLELLHLMRHKDGLVDTDIEETRHMLSRSIARAYHFVGYTVELELNRIQHNNSSDQHDKQRWERLNKLQQRVIDKQREHLLDKEEYITGREHVDFDFARWCFQAGNALRFNGNGKDSANAAQKLLRMSAKWCDKSLGRVLSGYYEDLMEGRLEDKRYREIQGALVELERVFRLLALSCKQCAELLLEVDGVRDGTAPKDIESKKFLDRAVKALHAIGAGDDAQPIVEFLETRFKSK